MRISRVVGSLAGFGRDRVGAIQRMPKGVCIPFHKEIR